MSLRARATFHTFEISHKARARFFWELLQSGACWVAFPDGWLAPFFGSENPHRLQHRMDDIQWARHSSCNWINNILFYWYDNIVSILGYFLVKNSAPKTIACSETGPMKGWRGKCCIWPKLQHHERERGGHSKNIVILCTPDYLHTFGGLRRLAGSHKRAAPDRTAAAGWSHEHGVNFTKWMIQNVVLSDT